MPRDKFAALASRAKKSAVGDSPGSAPRQQQLPDGSTSTSTAEQKEAADVMERTNKDSPPKRDKMAALAARSKNSPTKIASSDESFQIDEQHGQAGGSAKTTTSPPKRDKLAALAARSNTSRTDQQQDKVGGSDTMITPPKRDKMAALAARSNAVSQFRNATDMAQADQQKRMSGNSTTTASTSSPRRNKLAALASRSQSSSSTLESSVQAVASRNNKLAKLSAASQASTIRNSTTSKSKSNEEAAKETAIAREKHLIKLKEQLSKRKGILNRLDRAEKLTCKLLKIAARTTDSLQDLTYSKRLSELSIAYRSTLQELHPLLTIGTEEMIKPYQNHTKETKQSMYAARVEMRLAKERLEVLKTFSALEKVSRDEQKEVEVNNLSASDGNLCVNHGESDKKRKR